ncbi:hypothetical protein PVK06_044535 [Gossypium arboreum]|uniref:Uncharacterized protein n=1 Tax=Gossypium arboreum TaxID=29729 RepID=A0ABR0MRJ9_GOSAR|nr:hypothetical protein PVK06_044535 [Gossypium arboreum]
MKAISKGEKVGVETVKGETVAASSSGFRTGVWWKIGLILSSGISKQCAVPKDSLDFNGFKTFTLDMNDFIDCMENLKVIDHPFIGTLFTCCNMRLESPLFRKLDRVLVNSAWHSCFPVSVVEFLPLDVTNHSLSLVKLKFVISCPLKPFKYCPFWDGHPDFGKIV